jgi:peptidoglycan/LPS O-acetylase OafA/YrhL
VLRLRPLRWLGRISYGAYVFHMLLYFADRPILSHFVREFGLHGSQRELVTQRWLPLFALAFTILVAWLSFHFFESPFLNLKERWTVRVHRDLRSGDTLRSHV